MLVTLDCDEIAEACREYLARRGQQAQGAGRLEVKLSADLSTADVAFQVECEAPEQKKGGAA